jgi:hypothetical protein
MTQLRCPARESSEFLCDKPAEYQVNGTIYCEIHGRRAIEAKHEAAAKKGSTSDEW